MQKRVRIELDLKKNMYRGTQKNPKSCFLGSTFFLEEKGGITRIQIKLAPFRPFLRGIAYTYMQGNM
jgi:hypothetical protein